MRQLLLVNGHIALVDDKDYDFVSQKRWYAGGPNKSYVVSTANSRITLHRYILNPPKGMVIDHIDGNGLNCTRANMRVCRHAQNLMNRGKTKNNKSGYKGVFYFKRDGNWAAQIRANGKNLHLVYFDNPIAAARSYDAAAIKYHGEFAKPNF